MCRECWNKDGKPPIDTNVFEDNGKPAMRIPLTRGEYGIVDPKHYKRLSRHNYHIRIATTGKKYAFRDAWVDKKCYAIPMSADVIGLPFTTAIRTDQSELVVDHIDNDRTLDNREYNLRAATHGENALNRALGKNNTSGHKGVRKTKYGTYNSRVSFRGVTYYLGSSDTFEEACAKWEAKARELHGEFFRKK